MSPVDEDGDTMRPKVNDVERVKKQVRKLAAGKVLWGDASEACLELGRMECCQVRIAAGYGQLSEEPQPIPCDQFIWILDGHAEIYDAAGTETRISQGESTVLRRGEAYRLVFPQLSLYLLVEPEGAA
jgi:uncharacterized cupin superfamily protein